MLFGLLVIIYNTTLQLHYNPQQHLLPTTQQTNNNNNNNQQPASTPLPFYIAIQTIYTFFTTSDFVLYWYYGMHVYDYTIIQAVLNPGPLLANFRYNQHYNYNNTTLHPTPKVRQYLPTHQQTQHNTITQHSNRDRTYYADAKLILIL